MMGDGDPALKPVAMTSSDTLDESKDAPKTELHAFHNFQPIAEPTLRVEGTITMPTPGFSLELQESSPQGINPAILLLDLVVSDPDGVVAQVVTPTPVLFTKETRETYTQVSIQRFDGREEIPTIEVVRLD